MPGSASDLQIAENEKKLLRQTSKPLSAQGSDAHKRQSRFVKGTTIEKPPNNDGTGILAMLRHPLCVLLICFPLGVASEFLGWGSVWTFWLNFFGLIPLAKILGDATEELAAGLKNDMLAGLLNATFGNAVEVVIMMQTLRAGLLDIVKATLLGSVLSNLLLVLGCSFFMGGIVTYAKEQIRKTARMSQMSMAASQIQAVAETDANERDSEDEQTYITAEWVGEKVQSFSAMSAMVNTSMLLLACLSLSLVTVFNNESKALDRGSGAHSMLLPVSRLCSIVIMLSYVAYIFFQLVTHREAMAEGEEEDDEEEEEASISIKASLAVMFCTTLIVSFSSDLLIKSLETVVERTHLSSHFIGIVLLPIVGNACEHASAIRFAIQDKPGLSIGIAVGSSTQISLFVVPFSVLMGWWINQPMDLDFGMLNTTVVDVSVIIVLSVVVDGTANWLQGYLLCSAYLVIALLYWHLPDEMKDAV